MKGFLLGSHVFLTHVGLQDLDRGGFISRFVGSPTGRRAPSPSMGTAGELVDMLRAYRQRVPREPLALGPPPPLVDPPSSGEDDDVDSKDGDAGGGTRGRRHLQNDGDRRGRDPSGSNTL